jgi:GPH family glycoside/pentoside/hexuronide:cation symporter
VIGHAVAFVLAWFMVLGYFVNFLATTGYEEIETAEDLTQKKSKTKASAKDMAKSLFQNKPLCVLILADLPKWIMRFVPSGMAWYYFRYVAENMALLPQYILWTHGLGAFAGAFVSAYLAKQFTARNTIIYTYTVMVAALILVYFNYANPILVIALMAVVQVGQGICFSVAVALYADTAVYAQWKFGADSRGWIMGLMNVPLKVAIISRALIINISLAVVGFNAAALRQGAQEITTELQRGITVGFALIPAIFLVVGILLMVFGYKLTREKIVQYQAEIDARKAQG